MVVKRQVDMDSSAVNRGQRLLLATAMEVKGEKEFIRNGKRIGEVAGRTTAECAAVCCCCPCTMMHLLLLAVYKLPTGLCKKALKKKNKKTLSEEMKINNNKNGVTGVGSDGEQLTVGDDGGDEEDTGVTEAVELDSEMWDLFYGTGFWRSSSQREEMEIKN